MERELLRGVDSFHIQSSAMQVPDSSDVVLNPSQAGAFSGGFREARTTEPAPPVLIHSAPLAAGGPVSVVVPTCGRPEMLKRCLRALALQRLERGRYEVIVVDDRPSDATREAVEGFAATLRDRPVFRYVPNHGPHGPAAARNRGWRAAASPVIAFTDDDTEPDRDWLAKGLAAFTEGVHTVCGRVVMPVGRKPTDYERDAQGLETAEFVTANCLCRRDVLEQLGGFDERFRLAWREDSDLHFRLLQAGANIAYAREAIVVHPVRPAPWGVSVQQQKKVVFDALLFKKHRKLYRQRIRALPRIDYYAIVAALLSVPAGVLADSPATVVGGASVWLALTTLFFLQRLRGTSKSPLHIAEMLVTSALIPPVAVFWRMVGGFRFRVVFL
jgi:cellulose synthase/poly-beta-1,6-N-acetylglucosamine synthase-like glycosyltransferase